MAEVAAATTKCTECGLDSGTTVAGVKLGWRVRLVGTAVGVFMLAMWASYAFWPPSTLSTFGRGTTGSSYFIEPSVTQADLRAIAADPAPGRTRIVSPLLRFLQQNERTRFPFLEDAITLQLVPRDGEWYRTTRFGKPFAWLARDERGPLTPESPDVPAFRSIMSRGVSPTLFVCGNIVGAPGEVSISFGALSVAASIVLVSGWIAATIGPRRFRRHRRWRLWLLGSGGMLVLLAGWSAVAGEEVSTMTYPSSSVSAGGPGPSAAGPEMATFKLADLLDPTLSDARLAGLLLQDRDDAANGSCVAFNIYPAYAMVNWEVRDYGPPVPLIDVARMSYGRIDDWSQPAPYPANGWRWRTAQECLLISGATDGTSTVQREYSINLGLASIGVLSSALIGLAAGAAARWCGRIPARSRRREGRCIGCGNLLPAPARALAGESP